MSTLLKIGRSFSLVYPADLYKYGIIYIRVFWRLLTELNQENWLPEFISFLRKKSSCDAGRSGAKRSGVKGIALNLCF